MEQANPIEVFYQRRCAKYVYVVPSGLRELMTDISREVLRHHPKHVYNFIADYLDSLLITRENARVAAKLVENLTDTSIIIANLLMKSHITREQADKAARIIQRAFKRTLKKKIPIEVPLDDEEILDKIIRRTKMSYDQACLAACVIQRAYRRFRARRAQADFLGTIDWKLASRRTIGILRHLEVPRAEMERAATLIKAAYKGYYTRRTIRELVARTAISEEFKQEEEQVEEEFVEEEYLAEYPPEYGDEEIQFRVKAAIKIQRTFRVFIKKKHDEMELLTGHMMETDKQILETMIFR